MMARTVTAAALRGMLGANTHMGWQNTVTWGVANQPKVFAAFAYSGITLFRDGAPFDWNGLFPVYDRLYRDHGIQLCGGVSAPDGHDDVPRYAELETKTPGMLRAIEGENETQRAPADAKADLATLYHSVKNNPALSHVPVVSCSTTGADSIETIGSTAGISDMSNEHPYSGTSSPGRAISTAATRMQVANPGKPMMDSEFGWSITGLGAWSTVSDADRARFVLLGWMEAALAGVSTAIIYALMDNGPPGSTNNEDSFGMFAQDGTPHASGTAVRNMMAILADPATATAGATVPVTVTESGPNVLTVTKADGSQWLVMWPANDGPAADAKVTVSANVAAFVLHDPIGGPDPVARTYAGGTSVTVNVPTHPVVLEIGPASVVASPPGSTASQSGTVLNDATGSIVDGAGHVFTLVASARGLQVARDGQVDAPTQQVRLLAWVGATLYQVNVQGHGWGKASDATGAVAGAWTGVTTLPMAP